MSRRQVKRRKTWIVAEKLQRTGGETGEMVDSIPLRVFCLARSF